MKFIVLAEFVESIYVSHCGMSCSRCEVEVYGYKSPITTFQHASFEVQVKVDLGGEITMKHYEPISMTLESLGMLTLPTALFYLSQGATRWCKGNSSAMDSLELWMVDMVQ